MPMVCMRQGKKLTIKLHRPLSDAKQAMANPVGEGHQRKARAIQDVTDIGARASEHRLALEMQGCHRPAKSWKDHCAPVQSFQGDGHRGSELQYGYTGGRQFPLAQHQLSSDIIGYGDSFG